MQSVVNNWSPVPAPAPPGGYGGAVNLLGPRGQDPQSRRPVKRNAVNVERRSVHRLVAYPAWPCGVTAAVTQAGLMPDQHLVGAEGVPVRASRGRVGDPENGFRLNRNVVGGLKVATPVSKTTPRPEDSP